MLQVENKKFIAGDLKLHPLLTQLGISDDKEINATLDIFKSESKHFGHYNTICITKGNKVITQPEVWLAAKHNDPNQLLDVQEIDIQDDELIRFINFKSLFHKKGNKTKWIILNELKKYLKTNSKGKIWKKDLNESDTTICLSKITGYSRTAVKYYLRIGEYDALKPNDNVWDGIGHEGDQLSLMQMYNYVQGTNNEGDGEFSWNAKGKQRAQERQQKANKSKADNFLELLKNKGKQPLSFNLKWMETKHIYKGQCRVERTSNPDVMLYKYPEQGEPIIEIKVDVTRLFKLNMVKVDPVNKPINKKVKAKSGGLALLAGSNKSVAGTRTYIRKKTTV